MADLQQQWDEHQGPQLATADLAQPLPQLPDQQLVRLQALENSWQAPARAVAHRTRVWQVVQNTLRLCFSALFLALGFAAAAKGKGRRVSLLQKWLFEWFGSGEHPGGEGRNRISYDDDADYFEQITPRE